MNRIRVLWALVWMHTPLYAQAVDFNITGAGARAAGVGQAFIGVADDATAVVWNPSGLTTLERMEASIVGRQVFDVRDVSDDNTTNIDRLDIDNSHLSLNFSSFAYPFKFLGRKVVVAAAYQRQFDLYGKSNLFESNETNERLGGIDSFTPAFAVQVIPLVSVGAAANVWRGRTEFSIDGDEYGHYNYSGFNFVTGAMVDLGNLESAIPLKIGFTLRTPFKLKEDGREFTTDFENKYRIPAMIGGGVSYRFGENLLVAADFETRRYKKTELGDDDLNQFRAGAEYLWVNDFAVIPVRAGFQTAPTLIRDEDDKQVSGIALSIGSGIILSRLAFDVAMTRASYSYKSDPNTKVDTFKTSVIASTIFYF